MQGDIVAILDANDNTVVQYTYDIWGKLVSITGSLADTVGAINPLRYRGYYYDTETELYYLQSRYYSPDLMRFISQDDVKLSNAQGEPLGSNLYAYCLNNPVNYIDPYGTWIHTYKGFSKTNVGFNVDMNFKFLSKDFCKKFADKFLELYGSYKRWRGLCYSGMNKMRIAKELYAHAVLYCIGTGLLTMSYVSQSIKPYLKNIKFKMINKVVTYVSKELGGYLYNHSKQINVNSDEAWYRVVVFNCIWIWR